MSEMPVFNRPFESNSSSEPPNNKQAKTIRLNIDLNQVSRDGNVVLNYTKLLTEEKARRARGDHSGKSERDSKRLKLSDNRYQSYAELGAGYDDDDSFIDNTDAYEEGLPEDIDTKFGGYYVNSGELELMKKKTESRQESSTSSESTDSSESESSSEEEPKKEPVKKDHDSSDSKKPISDSDGKKKAKVIHVPMKDNKNSNSIYSLPAMHKDD